MNTAYIYEYWGRTEIGRKMIESDRVSESDLLFLMPNNVKKMHGLPMTRVAAKRKSHYKRLRKRMILSFSLFEMIEEIIEDIIPQTYNEEFFGQFVDFKNNNLGDKNLFLVPDKEEVAAWSTNPIKQLSSTFQTVYSWSQNNPPTPIIKTKSPSELLKMGHGIKI